jgi:hypothetical protein
MGRDPADALRARIESRHAVRLHCAIILFACFGVSIAVTWLLLQLGVATMWLRYALALIAAYFTFLLGVRLWLHYTGYRRIHGEVRDPADVETDLVDAVARGRAGGGASDFAPSDLGDVGDGGCAMVVVLAALVVAVAGSVLWLMYAAPAILVDAAFAALLSAGLVRSAGRAPDEDWLGSVVRNTRLAFTLVFVVVVVFAMAAQHYFPEARTLAEVWRRM